MGAAACGGRGFKARARVSGERPIGAASCRQQHNEVSCKPLGPIFYGGKTDRSCCAGVAVSPQNLT